MQVHPTYKNSSTGISYTFAQPTNQLPETQQQALLTLIPKLSQILKSLQTQYKQMEQKHKQQLNKASKQMEQKDKLILSLTKINDKLMKQNSRLKRKAQAQLEYFVKRIAQTQCNALNDMKKLEQVINNNDKSISKISIPKVQAQQQSMNQYTNATNQNRSTPLILFNSKQSKIGKSQMQMQAQNTENRMSTYNSNKNRVSQLNMNTNTNSRISNGSNINIDSNININKSEYQNSKNNNNNNNNNNNRHINPQINTKQIQSKQSKIRNSQISSLEELISNNVNRNRTGMTNMNRNKYQDDVILTI